MAAMCTPARSWLTAFIADPAPGLGAELEDRLGDGVEDRAGGGEGLRAARGHDRELAARRPCRPRPRSARRGRGRPPRRARAAMAAGEGGRDRGAGEDDRARAGGAAPPRRAEEHRLGLGGVQHHDDDGVEAAGATSARSPGAPPSARNRCTRLRAGVEAERGVAGAQERGWRCRSPWSRGRTTAVFCGFPSGSPPGMNADQKRVARPRARRAAPWSSRRARGCPRARPSTLDRDLAVAAGEPGGERPVGERHDVGARRRCSRIRR